VSVFGLVRSFTEPSIAVAAAEYVNLSWRRHRRQSTPHSLPGRLTVTLTSYPPRYSTLGLTLRSLLAQSVRPDQIYLWIAEADVASLPEKITRLRTDGLVIRACEDLRSYKKIIPALALGNDDFLLTADDDIYYPRHWLREIVGAYRAGRKEVICVRAHRIRLDARGMPLPYSQWENEVATGGDPRLLFPTGAGGVLYEPGIFNAEVTRTEIFRNLCPTGDDVWLYWMAALNGARFRKIGPWKKLIEWPHSQHVTLWRDINRTANDEQITNMIARYGFPVGATPSH
jgi:hypothetical protein